MTPGAPLLPLELLEGDGAGDEAFGRFVLSDTDACGVTRYFLVAPRVPSEAM